MGHLECKVDEGAPRVTQVGSLSNPHRVFQQLQFFGHRVLRQRPKDLWAPHSLDATCTRRRRLLPRWEEIPKNGGCWQGPSPEAGGRTETDLVIPVALSSTHPGAVPLRNTYLGP